MRRARNGKKSRRDDGIQAGASPLYHGPPPYKSPEGTTDPAHRFRRPFRTFFCVAHSQGLCPCLYSVVPSGLMGGRPLAGALPLPVFRRPFGTFAVPCLPRSSMRSLPLPVRAGFKRGRGESFVKFVQFVVVENVGLSITPKQFMSKYAWFCINSFLFLQFLIFL